MKGVGVQMGVELERREREKEQLKDQEARAACKVPDNKSSQGFLKESIYPTKGPKGSVNKHALLSSPTDQATDLLLSVWGRPSCSLYHG